MDSKTKEKLFSEFPPATTAEWERKITEELKGRDYERSLIWKTDEGFDVRPYYRSGDLAGLEYLNALPGQPPFVRGSRSEHNEWIIRQDIDFTDIALSNKLAVSAILKGVGGIGLKTNEVTSHRQLSDLLAGIDLDRTAINFISAQSYPLTVEFLIYELSHRGYDGHNLRGSVNFDPLSYLMLHGEFYINWQNDLEEAEYLLGIVRDQLPGFKVITVNGHYFQDAGSTLAQELAYSLASASEYLAGLTDMGLPADGIAPYFQFSMCSGPDYFMEIAKLRATRLLWTRMLEQYHAKNENSFRLFIHSATASWNNTIHDPYANLLRTTTEAMSAVLGNADSVSVHPFDVRFRDPNEFSQRIARNQQMILKHEAYLDRIADPAAGSYYVENLTGSIAQNAWDIFRDVEARGGMLACIKSGFIQQQVSQSRAKKESDIAKRSILLIGTNQYPLISEPTFDEIELSAGNDPEIPATYEKLVPFRAASCFEELRAATERFVKKGNKRPAVFLFTMGNLAMLRARAAFATNFFGCAGYEIMDNQGFCDISEGVAAAIASGAEVIVICSSDGEYERIVPEIASGIRQAGSTARIVVAGNPGNLVDAFRSAGVEDFIHLKSNLLETLKDYQNRLGITG